MKSELILNRTSRLLIFLGPLTTLAISPVISYDPINSIKNLIVASFSFSILAMLLRIYNEANERIGKLALFSAVSFVFAMVVVIFTSETAFSEQFYGVFGRNNGFLSYFSLVIIFVSTIAVQNIETYRLILRSLQITAIPMTFYCLIQIIGRDPFSWSAFATFGTLGNVNFLSAFMGLAVISTFYFMREAKSTLVRLGLFFLAITDILIIWQTDSIQGLMMIAAGIVIYLLLITLRRSRLLAVPYLLGLCVLTYFVLQSFVNRGPFAPFIYQPSITYRGDYMAAGWNIFLQKPVTGVGLDSYGDWYRAERGVVSTFRTGYGRTTNVAHNVYIDMAANGGLVLFCSFLLINLIVFLISIKALKRTALNDQLLIALFLTWAVFQIQSLVSIAQIGVSIWGWLISGALFGYSKFLISRKDSESNVNTLKKPRKVTLDPASSIVAFVGLAVGFTLSFLHFKVDIDYRNVSQKQDLTGMVSVTRNPLASSFFYVNTQYLALNNNYADISYEVNSRLRSKFPREIAGWFGLLNNPSASAQDRVLAKQKIGELDPYFFCLEPNFVSQIENAVLRLPQSQQRELAFAWGADSAVFTKPTFTLRDLGESFLTKRLSDFCS